MLHEAGLIGAKDREMMEMLCDSFGRWVLACAKCDTEGMTGTGSTGNDIINPWFRVRERCFAEVVKLSSCFGLSPADISNVKAAEKPSTDDTRSKFFRGAS